MLPLRRTVLIFLSGVVAFAQAPPSPPPSAVPALVVTKSVQADYSAEARAQGLQGTVLLALEVNPDGTVGDVRVGRGLGFGLDERAVAAAKQRQYKPFTADRPTMDVVEIPFRFEPRGPWSIVGSKFWIPSDKGPQQVRLILTAYTSPDADACPKELVYVPVDLMIGQDGKPNDVRVGATFDGVIGKAALEAVQSWRFQPGTVDGKPEIASGTILLECRGASVTGAADGAISFVGGGVSPPAVIFKVDPSYSEEARKAKYSGTVMFSLVVDTEGRARDVRVVKKLGLGLDEEAVIAVNQWRFKPAMKGGQPVKVRATVELNFRLL